MFYTQRLEENAEYVLIAILFTEKSMHKLISEKLWPFSNRTEEVEVMISPEYVRCYMQGIISTATS